MATPAAERTDEPQAELDDNKTVPGAPFSTAIPPVLKTTPFADISKMGSFFQKRL
jgi:hypothetical protein